MPYASSLRFPPYRGFLIETVSHANNARPRWLTPSATAERIASPDDAEGTKWNQVVTASRAYASANDVDEASIYIWIDFACVEQDDMTLLSRGSYHNHSSCNPPPQENKGHHPSKAFW